MKRTATLSKTYFRERTVEEPDENQREAKRTDYQTECEHDQLFIGQRLLAAFAHARGVIVKLGQFHPAWFRLIPPNFVKHPRKKTRHALTSPGRAMLAPRATRLSPEGVGRADGGRSDPCGLLLVILRDQRCYKKGDFERPIAHRDHCRPAAG